MSSPAIQYVANIYQAQRRLPLPPGGGVGYYIWLYKICDSDSEGSERKLMVLPLGSEAEPTRFPHQWHESQAHNHKKGTKISI